MRICSRPERCGRSTILFAGAKLVLFQAAPPTTTRAAVAPTSPRGGTKIARVIELLQRGDGATLAELVAATGWLPHTTRAALTGLRKRGYAVGIDRTDEARGSVHRIAPTERSDDSVASHVEASPTCEAPPDRPERAASRPTRRAA